MARARGDDILQNDFEGKGDRGRFAALNFCPYFVVCDSEPIQL